MVYTCKQCEKTYSTWKGYLKHFDKSFWCERGTPLYGTSNEGTSTRRN